MPSHQQSAPGTKSAKFVNANPLAPMANPFANDDEQSNILAENVDRRLKESTGEPPRACQEPQEQRDRRPIETDAAVASRRAEGERRAEEERRRTELERSRAQNAESDSSSDDEYFRDDPALEAIRNRRLSELKRARVLHAKHVSLGHGSVRTISQDEFLPECTGSSEWVATHFFHGDFARCEIMDHHLALIAPSHLTCKFLRIDARKSPFFVKKLGIRTLPALVVFRDGVLMDRLVGFEGLAKDAGKPDEWSTGKLQEWLAGTGAIEYEVPTEEVMDEMRKMGLMPNGPVWADDIGYDSDEC